MIRGAMTRLPNLSAKSLEARQLADEMIKGLAGHAENERADHLAREGVAMARLKS
jgi:ribonuclease HI